MALKYATSRMCYLVRTESLLLGTIFNQLLLKGGLKERLVLMRL